VNALCRIYWPPLYAFARRAGQSPDDARDLTQGFFASLVEKNWVADADPDRGRFRSFLLTAFNATSPTQNKRSSARKNAAASTNSCHSITWGKLESNGWTS
jgi:DNA-directed RNA polymerase specialized sigma24 family protein